MHWNAVLKMNHMAIETVRKSNCVREQLLQRTHTISGTIEPRKAAGKLKYRPTEQSYWNVKVLPQISPELLWDNQSMEFSPNRPDNNLYCDQEPPSWRQSWSNFRLSQTLNSTAFSYSVLYQRTILCECKHLQKGKHLQNVPICKIMN